MLVTLLSLVLMTTQVASAVSLNDETWKIVKSPNGSLHNNILFGVAAISKHDAWAVGANYTGNDGPPLQALIEHWNGSQWSVVHSTNVGTHDNILIGATAVSANDVWTDGFFNDRNNMPHTFIEHWNGKKWNVVPSPNVGLNNVLVSMVAVSASDIWTVGDIFPASGIVQPLMEHWNGSQWSVVQTPNIGSGGHFFQYVAADSANDLWAVGAYINNAKGQQNTLIEHCC